MLLNLLYLNQPQHSLFHVANLIDIFLLLPYHCLRNMVNYNSAYKYLRGCTHSKHSMQGAYHVDGNPCCPKCNGAELVRYRMNLKVGLARKTPSLKEWKVLTRGRKAKKYVSQLVTHTHVNNQLRQMVNVGVINTVLYHTH